MKHFLLILSLCITQAAFGKKIDARKFGLLPNHPEVNAAALMQTLCSEAKRLSDSGERVTISLAKGKYFFYPDGAAERTLFISNHDQPNPKRVGIAMCGLRGVTLDGHGAELIFDGQMLPISLVRSTDCTLRNFSIDFSNPHIAQAEVIENTDEGTKMRLSDEVKWQVYDGALWTEGLGWQYHADYAIAFEGATHHLVPGTSDFRVPTRNLVVTPDSLLWAKEWKDKRMKPGTRLALRTWNRPAPAIFLANDVRTQLTHINIHYAEGMGLLAQCCEDIVADGLNVCLRGTSDKRYFTTQADATHFSGCKGKIIERNSLYEGMMDDAINVHGTYLKVIKRLADNKILARYMHEQSYCFEWGNKGDTVQFVSSQTMEKIGRPTTIAHIVSAFETPDGTTMVRVGSNVDDNMSADLNREFVITLTDALDPRIDPEKGSFGVENLEWTPEVLFENNIVRNNRARGSLFSTPRRVVVRGNTFDHTSGCAILLCGDCNGWYETGACHDVLIERNRFINALTNEFQFTNAIISIYPEIPDLEHQQQYFHSNIRIQNNHFDTFLRPLLYAKSVDGLSFTDNKVHFNTDFPAQHWNTHCFLLEHVKNFSLSGTRVTGTTEAVESDVQSK